MAAAQWPPTTVCPASSQAALHSPGPPCRGKQPTLPSQSDPPPPHPDPTEKHHLWSSALRAAPTTARTHALPAAAAPPAKPHLRHLVVPAAVQVVRDVAAGVAGQRGVCRLLRLLGQPHLGPVVGEESQAPLAHADGHVAQRGLRVRLNGLRGGGAAAAERRVRVGRRGRPPLLWGGPCRQP